MATWNSNQYKNRWGELEEFYQLKLKNMASNLWTLNWTNISGAVASSVLSAVLMYLSNLTNLATFSWHTVISTVIVVGATSLLKAFSTDSKGNLVGQIPVK